MNHPFIQNGGRAWLYILILGLLALALGGALAPLPGVGFGQGAGVGTVLAFVFGALALPLWDAVRYGTPNGRNESTRGTGKPQKILTLSVLALLMLTLWLGVSVLAVWFFWPEGWPTRLLPALPFLALIGVLLYTVTAMIYLRMLDDREDDREDEEETESRIDSDSGPENVPPKTLTVIPPLETIAVKTGRKIDVVPVAEISYLKSEGDYVMIYTSSGHFLKEQTMKYFEQNLPAVQFVRVHRSYIVNVRAILRIERYGKGEQLLVLQGGATVRASEAGYRELRSRLKL